MKLGFVTIKKHADCMHRVVNHVSKCRHVHGHSYLYDLTFSYPTISDIGYSLDFAEIKRIGVQWIEDHMDHGAILNPHDKIMIEACDKLNSKIWIMSLNGESEYCNPSVENIAKEVFLVMEVLFKDSPITPHQIKIYETPNCYTDCFVGSISDAERANFYKKNESSILAYRSALGTLEYDDRKTK